MISSYFDNLDGFISHLKSAASKRHKRYAVIGDPVSHSLSPILHKAAYPDCEYYAVRVSGYQLAKFCLAARQYLDGFNVTVPHKLAVQDFLDSVTEEVQEVGAVNTVLCGGGKLTGYNTDVYGIKMALTAHGMADNKSAAVLGAGGAAAAAAAALKSLGMEVCIAARNTQKAQQALPGYNVIGFDELKNVPCGLVVNCTPVGMSSTSIDRSPVDIAQIPHCRSVYDTIYSPLTTKLLKSAKNLGLSTANGLSMLIYQGLQSQKIWGSTESQKDYDNIYAVLCAAQLSEKLAQRKKSIALCGFMGSGKSTVAANIAKLTGLPLLETDKQIEKEQGQSIAQIFEKYKEPHFRALESAAIARADDGVVKVLSLGGGAVIDPKNAAELKKFCDIVFIDIPLNTALSRVKNAADRPLISGSEIDVQNLYERRLPIYNSAADITVSGNQPVMRVVADILEML